MRHVSMAEALKARCVLAEVGQSFIDRHQGVTLHVYVELRQH